MSTAIICVILVLICIYAVRSYVKKLRQGGGCCGEHEAAEKKVKVSDKDKSHYPYTVILAIDGMTCSNCVRRVENALNRLEGVWATAELTDKGNAIVRMKQEVSEAELRQAVRNQGYTVLSVQKQS